MDSLYRYTYVIYKRANPKGFIGFEPIIGIVTILRLQMHSLPRLCTKLIQAIKKPSQLIEKAFLLPELKDFILIYSDCFS
jgi:hypothetical protein